MNRKTGGKTEEKGRYSEEVEEIVDGLTLFDDDLMSRVFDKNIAATELLLRIIFKRPIKVKKVQGQEEIRGSVVNGRTIRLDIFAVEENGDEIDVEVQGNSKGADVKRARYHSSMMDSRMLKKGQDFSEIKNSYVIFIYRHDKFGLGLPVYHIKRTVTESGEAFGDGSEIIYVNGAYTGDDAISRLVADFRQTDFTKINYPELAEGVRYYKSEGGRENMCEAVERYAEKQSKKAEKRGAFNTQVNNVTSIMVNGNVTMDQALDLIGVQGKERTLIIDAINKRQK